MNVLLLPTLLKAINVAVAINGINGLGKKIKNC